MIEALSNRWREHFADEMARRICDAEAVGVLYRLVTEPLEGIPTPLRHKLLFRGAYVLERIYFTDRTAFLPHAEAFCRRDFAACSDPSVRRHFGKIMTDLLERARPDAASLDGIAETALAEGRVLLHDTGGQELVGLRPGQKAVYHSDTRKVDISDVPASEMLMRRDGVVFMENVTIEQIRERLEKDFGVSLRICGESDGRLFTLSYVRTARLDDVLDMVEVISGYLLETE